MFVLLPGLARVDVDLQLLVLEGGFSINTSPRCKAKSLMKG